MKKEIKNIKYVYLIGIGGIGMSALARYFVDAGKIVAGYDRSESKITDALSDLGCDISFVDSLETIPSEIINADKSELLIIFTPAIPKNSIILNYFINKEYELNKRSEVLGIISNNHKTVAVAGTHGKTSVSTMIAHIFHNSDKTSNAILGGISKNYNSNFILDKNSKSPEYLITEADEFDRSFLQLYPHTAVITSMDADHLDIYSDINDLQETFRKFMNQIDKKGNLIIKKGLITDKERIPQNVYTYSFAEESDFFALNVFSGSDFGTFDISTPKGIFKDFKISIPGRLNIENAVAAFAASFVNGIDAETIKNALSHWNGVKRRFEYIIKTPEIVFIDDYAHHPEEIKAFVASVKDIYKDKKILGIFQPHLFSRTRDFSTEFANELSELENIILLEIYPAREEPIPGVTSDIIFSKIKSKNKIKSNKEDLLKTIDSIDFDIVLTIGAGDIDKMVEPIKKMLLSI